MAMTLCVQCERDEDGCWLAKMPGAIAYGETIEEAIAKVEALALQATAEPVNQGDAGSSA
jgi:predicted RNase H-like HicB family nuclease